MTELTASHRALARLSASAGIQVNQDPDSVWLRQSIDLNGRVLLGVDYHGRLVVATNYGLVEVTEQEASDWLVTALSIDASADTSRVPPMSDVVFGTRANMDVAVFKSIATGHDLSVTVAASGAELAFAYDSDGVQWTLCTDGLAYAHPGGKAYRSHGSSGLSAEEFDDACGRIAWAMWDDGFEGYWFDPECNASADDDTST